jgi:MerR family transcriptional regulator/heat shock protein HspR
MVNEGINLAGIKRIIELESAMSNMAMEVARLRVEVDYLLSENRGKNIAVRNRLEVATYQKVTKTIFE